MTYSTKDKVILMFGFSQLLKWSDIDGERQDSPMLDARIADALQDADDYINERLVNNGYIVPFATNAVPRRIVNLATLYAGIYLYDSKVKGGADNPSRDEVSRARKRFNMLIRQILNGQLKLIHPTSGEAIEKESSLAPSIAESSSSLSTWCNVCCCNICCCDPSVYYFI